MTLIISPALPGFVYGQNMCGDTPWGLPLEGDLKVNSPFNNTKKPFHYGVDYKAADGDNVLAVADGKIGKIGYNIRRLPKPNPRTGLMVQGWGRYVVVDHTDGSQTLYAHLLMDSTNDLSDGMPVTKGTIIGKADSTGGVTGPHLHLEYSPAGEIFDNKSKIDPEPCVGHKPVECGTSNIGYTTQQMSINQTQTLTVTNPDPGATYTWAVASGGGSISPTTGTSVVYTAPATNPNCNSNPTITMSVGSNICDTLRIAVNYVTNPCVQATQSQCLGSQGPYYACCTTFYNCFGDAIPCAQCGSCLSLNWCTAFGCSVVEGLNGQLGYQQYCGIYYDWCVQQCSGPIDIRSEELK